MTSSKTSQKILAIRGMNDLLPKNSSDWELLESKIISWLHSYGYMNIRVPILEQTRLFKRGIGEVTDIVEKEMYSFCDSYNNDSLTMRPEITAGIVRSSIEHNFLYDRPRRLYSIGPVFRHERPQLGRYRQFHQIDVEAMGFQGPDLDAELIIMLSKLWEILGIQDIKLEINCLGSYEDRLNYKKSLVDYLKNNIDHLDENSQKRLLSNPLRILDTKNPNTKLILRNAPVLFDFLSSESLIHFKQLCSFLDKMEIKYCINNHLVRGLDYYNLTVFEWITDKLGAQGTVCGGGRYDSLISLLGGKLVPSAGFAIGFERLIELWKSYGNSGCLSECDIYITHQGLTAQSLSFHVAENLRKEGYNVIVHCGLNDSLKRQFKMANSVKSKVAIVFGENELKSNSASVKFLQLDNRINVAQEIVLLEQLVAFLKNRLK
ncbi:histidyl-tRNA synthetase [Candidatus Kinetoplastibacterium desouzaii TCC079E]|uniref:Histidine--tRNA ligase n=1 Tax=Candidatus Kinetoplastidibacterium desouzai TCC079E TaxID=1208919 RepID=M1LUF9_9PROT|nr:histidine--tRNA ligase [Candidatus Kinetoplastibacterium desouzaii]AGF46944.1 histidyl-tRNA synthetase [Candidatus Kinetoplastibacterium desouzaii TCC079E]